MASSGPNYPTSISTQAVAPEDDHDWTNPTNIGADDGAYATMASSINLATYSYRLKAQGFAFAIPAGATIDGIKVEIERHENSSSYDGLDYRVQLLDAAGALVGDNKASATEWSTTMVIATYGGATDTWAASPTAAMVNDVDFGVVLSLKFNSHASGYTGYVDFIRITIYYTAGVIYDETNKLQVILGIQGSADAATRNEVNKSQVILATLAETNVQTMQETNRLQVLLAVPTETDTQTMRELDRLQVMLGILSETDSWLFNETDRLQVILFTLSVSESLVALRQLVAPPVFRDAISPPAGRSLVAPPSGREVKYP